MDFVGFFFILLTLWSPKGPKIMTIKLWSSLFCRCCRCCRRPGHVNLLPDMFLLRVHRRFAWFDAGTMFHLGGNAAETAVITSGYWSDDIRTLFFVF